MDLSAWLSAPGQFAAMEPMVLTVLGPAVLLTVRFAGLAYTAPLISSPAVPHRLRIGLAVVLGVCCGLSLSTATVRPIASLNTLLSCLPGEFILGAALGLGAKLLLTGLELAARLVDVQTGSSLAAIMHPELNEETTPTGAWLALVGGLTWLTLSGVGGDLRIVAAVLDSVRMLPPGELSGIGSPVRLVQDVVLSSMVLGLQVAAPLTVAIGLVNGLCATLARARGGGAWMAALQPVRTLAALLILAATTTAVGERVASGIDGFLRNGVQQLTASMGEEAG